MSVAVERQGEPREFEVRLSPLPSGIVFPRTHPGPEPAADGAPYLGLGYDGTFQGFVPVSFFVTAGVLFQGSPSIVLTESTGAVPQADLDAEAQQFEDDASNFEYYPVIAIGLTIIF